MKHQKAYWTCSVCRTNYGQRTGCTGGTGYGVTRSGRKVCYACCAVADMRGMHRTGRAVLYLTDTDGIGRCAITNWPGSLRLQGRYRKGNHNMAGCRYDVWFRACGRNWHGVTYGDNTQICHCRRIVS